MPPSADVRSEAAGVDRSSSGQCRESPDARAKPRCDLVCIPPDKVALVWPRVSGLIFAAMKRGDLSSFQPVESSVLAGHALLWLAVARDGVQIHAAAVTELHRTEWRKVCVIVACGGSDMGRWLDLIGPIEAFARAEKCSAMRIMGRKGWARVLPAYQPKRVVLEKEL